MTIEEAKLILPVAEDDFLEDAFETKLFEFKQFFLASLPTSKLFQAKIKRIEQLSEAYSVLGGKEKEEMNHQEAQFSFSSENVKEVIQEYQKKSSEIKLNLLNASNSSITATSASQLVSCLREFASRWQLNSEQVNSTVKISKTPDQMQLLKAVNDFNQENKFTFEEINSLPEDNLLKQEAIRLSLWLKFENNV